VKQKPIMKKQKAYPARAAQVFVTQKMLYSVKDELSSTIKGAEARLEGKIDSNFHQLSAQIHSIKILVEEQNAKNNIVLDGLMNLFDRQDRIETSWTKFINKSR
jgi:hypothetical protein